MNYRLTTPALYVTLYRKTLDTSLLKVSKNIMSTLEKRKPICDCGVDSESEKHCSMYCPRYAAQRNVLLTSAASNRGHGHRAAMQGN